MKNKILILFLSFIFIFLTQVSFADNVDTQTAPALPPVVRSVNIPENNTVKPAVNTYVPVANNENKSLSSSPVGNTTDTNYKTPIPELSKSKNIQTSQRTQPQKYAGQQKAEVSNVDFAPYMRNLQRKIKSNWHPPKHNESKRVVMFFKVAKDGSLVSSKIIQSSGNDATDNAAIAALKASVPFDPLPAEFKGKSVDIQFTFDYNVLKSSKRTANNNSYPTRTTQQSRKQEQQPTQTKTNNLSENVPQNAQQDINQKEQQNLSQSIPQIENNTAYSAVIISVGAALLCIIILVFVLINPDILLRRRNNNINVTQIIEEKDLKTGHLIMTERNVDLLDIPQELLEKENKNNIAILWIIVLVAIIAAFTFYFILGKA